MKLLKRFAKIAGYFLFDGSVGNNLKKHTQIKELLAPFIADKLMPPQTPLLYLRKYISTAFSLGKNYEVLSHHYNFIKNRVPAHELKHIYIDGVVCYTEENYKIILSGSEAREREGSLSLYFKDGDTTIAQVSFSISSGKALEVADENVIVISRFQQINAHLENIKEAKKHFGDIMPTHVLLTVLEAIGVILNIKSIVGLYGVDQLSWEPQYERSYLVNYDEFWQHNGGEASKYGYVMECPLPQKDLLEIKQTHRNRAKKKRDRLEAIYDHSFGVISKVLAK